MKVRLGKFAQSGVESQLGTNLTEAVETAIRHYTGKLTYGRPPTPYPQFLGTKASQDFGTHTSASDEVIELNLDSGTEALLRREAMRHDTDVNAIVTHSVMVYLAEIDFLSGRSRQA